MANLTMQDIGRLPWVKEVLKKLLALPLRRVKIKLRTRIIETINQFVGSQVTNQAEVPLVADEPPFERDAGICGPGGSSLSPRYRSGRSCCGSPPTRVSRPSKVRFTRTYEVVVCFWRS